MLARNACIIPRGVATAKGPDLRRRGETPPLHTGVESAAFVFPARTAFVVPEPRVRTEPASPTPVVRAEGPRRRRPEQTGLGATAVAAAVVPQQAADAEDSEAAGPGCAGVVPTVPRPARGGFRAPAPPAAVLLAPRLAGGLAPDAGADAAFVSPAGTASRLGLGAAGTALVAETVLRA